MTFCGASREKDETVKKRLALLFGQCALAAYMVNNVFYDLLDLVGSTVATHTGRVSAGDVPFYRALVHVVLLIALVYAWRVYKQGKSTR